MRIYAISIAIPEIGYQTDEITTVFLFLFRIILNIAFFNTT